VRPNAWEYENCRRDQQPRVGSVVFQEEIPSRMRSARTWEQLGDLEDRVNSMHVSKIYPLTVVAVLDGSTVQVLQEQHQYALNDAGDADEELSAMFDVVGQR
jgi:hypothetical protein